jgi:hypothetical protein
VSFWTPEELDLAGSAEEIELSSVRQDGTLRSPVVMWVVRYGDDLYVRSVNGQGSSWFVRALQRHQATVSAGGIERDVSLVEIDGVGDKLDDAYRAKYGSRYPTIVPSIVAPEARAATLKLEPR